MASVRALGKRLLPDSMVDRYRRRRVLRNFMRELGYELYDRQIKLHVEQVEGIVLAKRPDITSRLFNDVLRFTDALLQELDRKIEGLRARHGNELREARDEIAGLREQIAALREQVTALQVVVGQPPAQRAAPDVSPTGSIVD